MFEADNNPFDDGRGRFPDKISVNAPKGFRDLAKRAAEQEGVSLAEFVRRRLYEAVSNQATNAEHARNFRTAADG
jgi:hypothetical protein